MAYLAQGGATGPDSVAALNARIGGLRGKIKERKLAISERCIAKFRTGLVPGGMLLDSETALWCREVIDHEAEIQSLLERIREMRAAEENPAEPSCASPQPPSPALRFSGQIIPPPPPAPRPVVLRAAPRPPAPREAPDEPPAPPAEPKPVKPTLRRVKQPLPAFTPSADGQGGVVVCKICGLENKKGTRFCQECGTPLASAAPPTPRIQPEPATKLFCPECGEPNDPASKFCGDCGERLSE